MDLVENSTCNRKSANSLIRVRMRFQSQKKERKKRRGGYVKVAERSELNCCRGSIFGSRGLYCHESLMIGLIVLYFFRGNLNWHTNDVTQIEVAGVTLWLGIVVMALRQSGFCGCPGRCRVRTLCSIQTSCGNIDSRLILLGLLFLLLVFSNRPCTVPTSSSCIGDCFCSYGNLFWLIVICYACKRFLAPKESPWCKLRSPTLGGGLIILFFNFVFYCSKNYFNEDSIKWWPC